MQKVQIQRQHYPQWKTWVEIPICWRTLEVEEADLKASANGPPILLWFPPLLHQFMFCCCSLSLLLLFLMFASSSSSFPVESFKETSEGGLPGMEMERWQVDEVNGLEVESDDLGQSSKKGLRMWPSSDLPLLNPLWVSYGLLLLLLSWFMSEGQLLDMNIVKRGSKQKRF